jgi:hypothetical protein
MIPTHWDRSIFRLGFAQDTLHIWWMTTDTKPPSERSDDKAAVPLSQPRAPSEIGGPKGPEPTRYGDWESNGRCTDF